MDYNESKVGIHALGANGQHLSSGYIDVTISETESEVSFTTADKTNVTIVAGSTKVVMTDNGGVIFYIQNGEIFSPAEASIADGFKVVTDANEQSEIITKIEGWTTSSN